MYHKEQAFIWRILSTRYNNFYFFNKGSQVTKKTFRTHKTYSKENLIKSIKGHIPDLNEIMNTDDVNNQVNILNNVLLTAINNCAPLITSRAKRKQINGWMIL